MQVATFFTVRIWREELGEGTYEWRGRLQCIPGGQVAYFRKWSVLIEQLQQLAQAAYPTEEDPLAQVPSLGDDIP